MEYNCNQKWGPVALLAAQKQSLKEARLVESQVCFLLDGGGMGWGGAGVGGNLSKRSTPSNDHQWVTG